jgi:hypothetical protein
MTVLISANAEIDAIAKATGDAFNFESESDNVAAAVGFNYVKAENTAIVDDRSGIISDGSITVEAVTMPEEPNEFVVWGAAGAGGQGDGAGAGSVAINIVKFRTEASTPRSGGLRADDDITVQAENDLRIQTLAVGAAFCTGDDAAVGASIAVAVVDGINADGDDDTDDPMTLAYMGGTARAGGDILVSAETDFGPYLFQYEILGYDIDFDVTAMAISGAATTGDAGIGAAVIVNVFALDTIAHTRDDTSINNYVPEGNGAIPSP